MKIRDTGGRHCTIHRVPRRGASNERARGSGTRRKLRFRVAMEGEGSCGNRHLFDLLFPFHSSSRIGREQTFTLDVFRFERSSCLEIPIVIFFSFSFLNDNFKKNDSIFLKDYSIDTNINYVREWLDGFSFVRAFEESCNFTWVRKMRRGDKNMGLSRRQSFPFLPGRKIFKILNTNEE